MKIYLYGINPDFSRCQLYESASQILSIFQIRSFYKCNNCFVRWHRCCLQNGAQTLNRKTGSQHCLQEKNLCPLLPTVQCIKLRAEYMDKLLNALAMDRHGKCQPWTLEWDLIVTYKWLTSDWLVTCLWLANILLLTC